MAFENEPSPSHSWLKSLCTKGFAGARAARRVHRTSTEPSPCSSQPPTTENGERFWKNGERLAENGERFWKNGELIWAEQARAGARKA